MSSLSTTVTPVGTGDLNCQLIRCCPAADLPREGEYVAIHERDDVGSKKCLDHSQIRADRIRHAIAASSQTHGRDP